MVSTRRLSREISFRFTLIIRVVDSCAKWQLSPSLKLIDYLLD